MKINIKRNKLTFFLPRIIIFMMFVTYFSGLLYFFIDIIAFFVGIIILSIFLFFLPFDKMMNFLMMKLDKDNSNKETISTGKKELNDPTEGGFETSKPPNI